ncbi:MAG: DHH family phosphoesterase [Candidatus Acetothermia bacterium]
MAYKELAESFQKVEGKLAISSFGNPDPDAIACAFALGKIADEFDIEFEYVFESSITRPENQSLINYLGLGVKKLADFPLEEIQAMSLVDCTPFRLSQSYDTAFVDKLNDRLISVQDHHPIEDSQREQLENQGLYVDIRPELGACVTILAEALAESDLNYDTETATALFYGLYTDTSSLLQGFTSVDFQQATRYVDAVDKEELNDIKGADMTSETYSLMHRVTDDRFVEVRGTYKFADAGSFRSKDKFAVPQIADLLHREEGIEGIVVAGINSDEKIIEGSVRYSGSRFTAEEIADKLANGEGSGGGHMTIGGFQIRPGVLRETIDKVPSQEALMDSVKERFFEIVGKEALK